MSVGVDVLLDDLTVVVAQCDGALGTTPVLQWGVGLRTMIDIEAPRFRIEITDVEGPQRAQSAARMS